MSKPIPIAVLISDLHLTLQPPACRKDIDWMAVQAHYLFQVKSHKLPVVCAGDVFDRWNPPPELINFALRYLPDRMISVPGQHDLPLHRRDLVHRSGYGVLMQAEKITDISEGGCVAHDNGFVAYGFGWNEPIEPLGETNKGRKAVVNLAVIHRYCWTEDHKYPGAPEEGAVTAFRKSLKGYDAAVFGDNHKGFLSAAGDCPVLNCGGFIRRKSDEIDYRPGYGILYSNGAIKRQYFNTDIDVFHAAEDVKPEVAFDMSSFVAGLESLGESGMDFRTAVEEHLKKNDLPPGTKEIILTALGS